MNKEKELFDRVWNVIESGEGFSEEEMEEDVRKVIDYMYDIVRKPEPDFSSIMPRVNSNSNNKRWIRKLLKFASILVLPLFVYLGLREWNTRGEQAVGIDDENVVKLILASGETINLSDFEYNVIQDKEIEILKEGNSITYEERISDNEIVEYGELHVPYAADYRLRLSDGSIVYLNSDSKLRFPAAFNSRVRKVFLEGEAYFEVRSDSTRPFIVEVNDVKVEVLGTSFNINAYPEKGAIQTTLESGVVKVFTGNQSTTIFPGQQAICDTEEITVRDVDVRPIVSWKDGIFIFHRMSLTEIMAQIRRWYDLNPVFLSEEVKDYTFTGLIDKNLAAEETFTAISKAINVEFEIKDNDVLIIKK